jgi:hypothetical protein
LLTSFLKSTKKGILIPKERMERVLGERKEHPHIHHGSIWGIKRKKFMILWTQSLLSNRCKYRILVLFCILDYECNSVLSLDHMALQMYKGK